MRIRFAICLPVLLAGSAALAAKKPVTLDTVMEQRRGGESGGTPAWAPDGRRFVYFKGKQVMLYDVPARRERELFSLDPLEAAAQPPEVEKFDWRNRRVRQNSFAWSDDGKLGLVAVSGDLFLWRMDGAKWEQLTKTPEAEADPKLSPDGARVAFRRGHDLYSLDIASKKTTRLSSDGSPTLLNGELDWVYPEELDLGTAYWWSPDSRRIGYLQFDISREVEYPQVDLRGRRAILEMERYPQAGTPNADVKLGVVAAEGGPTKWMDLGERRDQLFARVHWTPDSRSLAVFKLNRVQSQIDFILASAESGSSRTLLHETDRAWVNSNHQFRFLNNGQFLWSSERDGFRHLYLYAADGKQLARVTEGNWEVEEIAGLDESRRRVYYVSTEASPLERQLYAVNLDGTGRTRLTREPGTHSISMAPNCEYFLDTYSSLKEPPRRVLRASDGAEWAVYREADRKIAEDYEILPSEIVTVKTSDGTPLFGRMVKPANFEPSRKYPAIVMIYGGPGAQSVRDSWTGASWEQALAHRGFVVWQMDNRGSAGRGHAFESGLYRRLGEKELADQREGVRYLAGLGYIDPARIGIYGWSYGGFMTLYALFNAPDLFRAGVAGAPVTDWHNYDTIYTERYLGLPADNAEAYRLSSAITYADKLKAKLLILHNIEDDNVLFQNTIQIADALERAGKTFSMVVYPQKTHGVTGPVNRQLMETATEFFEKNLK